MKQIEKIDIEFEEVNGYSKIILGKGVDKLNNGVATLYKAIIDKINELVDIVNNLEEKDE